MSARKTSRLRASFGRRCIRQWLRVNGRIVRLLTFTDYSKCDAKGGDRCFMKVLNHCRYPRGMQIVDPSSIYLDIAERLEPGVWTEIVFKTNDRRLS
ncbi:MAG: hypothetical protein Q7K57_08760 [Burkholderiaceae bacterium]|nr:hypothetical protein [Burkholderiaceae bacterium]